MPTPNAPRKLRPVMSETDSECGYTYTRHGAYISAAGTGLTEVTLWRVAGCWVAGTWTEGSGRLNGPAADTKDGAVNALIQMLEER